MEISFFLPVFNGFYGTYFECNCEEIAMNDDNTTSDDYDFDYADYRNRVAKSCVNAVAFKLIELNFPCNIFFTKLHSPRYYNFENDEIECIINFEMKYLNEIINICTNAENLENFKSIILETHQSRSGFTSFVDTNIDVWLNVYLKPDYERFPACLTFLLDFYLSINDYTDEELSEEYSVAEQMQIIEATLKIK